MVDAIGADADVAARNAAVRPLLLEADDACLLGPRRERWVRRQGVGLLGLLANRLGRAGRLGVHSRARRARLLGRDRKGLEGIWLHHKASKGSEGIRRHWKASEGIRRHQKASH